MKQVIVLPDVHLLAQEEIDPSYKLAKRFIKDQQPDEIVILGDFLDLPQLSVFSQELTEITSKQLLAKDYALANRELDWLQSHTKKIYYLEGNHEFRAEKYIQKNPILRGTIDVDVNLHLKQRKIPYLREVEGPLKIGRLYFVHGWYYNKYVSAKTLDEFGGNICIGHTHTIQQYFKKIKANGEEIGCWSIGCLCSKDPEYLRGKPNRFQNGLAVVFFDTTGSFSLYQLHMVSGSFIYGNKTYK